MGLTKGSQATFTPDKGNPRTGTITAIKRSANLAKITLDGDPFPVKVRLDQLSSCEESGNNVGSSTKVRNTEPTTTTTGESKSMTTTRTSAKELRRQAQNLGIDGWQDMGRAELTKAVKRAQAGESKPKSKPASSTRKPKSKTASKSKRSTAPAKKVAASKKAAPARKTAAKKAAAPKSKAPEQKGAKTKAEPVYTEPPKGVASPDEPTNPFRKGSNLHVIFPILVPRGGTRRKLAERLQQKVELHPYSGDDSEVDLLDYDKRMLLCAQTLRDKHGYVIERKGRGLDGTIKVFIPGGEHDPRVSSNGKSKTAGKKRTRKG